MPNHPSKQKKTRMSYPCEQAIMTYLNPNLRRQIGSQCSELKSLEKVVPLICDEIELNDIKGSTRINGVSYAVVISMKHDTLEKESETVFHDVDEEGRRTNQMERMMFPGDVQIDDHSNLEWNDDPFQVAKLSIQFSVGEVIKEELEYSKKLVEAHHYLNTKLFGNRDCPIQTRRLRIGDKVLRLPENVKFRIKELEVFSPFMKMISGVQSILTPDSFPLEYLRVCDVSDQRQEYNHPVVRSAKRIRVTNFVFSEGLIQFLMSARNKTITVDPTLPIEEYITLIENLRANAREIGTSIIFLDVSTKKTEEIFNHIMERFNFRENDDGDIFISLNEDTEVKISAGDDPTEYAFSDYKKSNFFKLEVVSVPQRDFRTETLRTWAIRTSRFKTS